MIHLIQNRPLLAMIGLLLTACGGAHCPVTPPTDGNRLLQLAHIQRGAASTIRAEARVDRRDDEGRIRGTILFFAQRPDNLRFDAMTQFGPVAVLTNANGEFALNDLGEDRFFRGPSCARNIARLLGAQLEAQDMVRLLLGEAPDFDGAERVYSCRAGTTTVEHQADNGAVQRVLLQLREGDENREALDQRYRISQLERFDSEGVLLWRVHFDDYRLILDRHADENNPRALAMPFRIRLEQPSLGIDTLLRFQAITLNPNAPRAIFEQRARPGLRTEEVGCE